MLREQGGRGRRGIDWVRFVDEVARGGGGAGPGGRVRVQVCEDKGGGGERGGGEAAVEDALNRRRGTAGAGTKVDKGVGGERGLADLALENVGGEARWRGRLQAWRAVDPGGQEGVLDAGAEERGEPGLVVDFEQVEARDEGGHGGQLSHLSASCAV